MRPVLGYLVLLALMGACGGSDAPTQTQDPKPLLDFSAIAGPWAGWGVEVLADGSTRPSWIRIDVEESAAEGTDVGDFWVGLAPGDTLCALSLRALASDPPEYRFQLLSSQCTGAMMDVEHDTDAGVLFLDIANAGENFTTSHILERGTDPGPGPN